MRTLPACTAHRRPHERTLHQAGLAERDRFDWRKAVVVAIARDGYRAVFSWPELANTAAGAQVMVVYERDGAP
ncbi:MAG: hypothetical protein ACHP83_03750, partial [Burkholderiales bacterium]